MSTLFANCIKKISHSRFNSSCALCVCVCVCVCVCGGVCACMCVHMCGQTEYS